MDAKLYAEEKPEKASTAKDVALWLERIQITSKAQNDWADQSGAKRFIKEYKGDYGIMFHTRLKKVPIPPINEVFAYVQSDIAMTYNRDPYISVNAEAGTTKGAALWEVILNYYWRKLEIKEEIEHEIIDKDLVGYGWHKVGMTSDGKLYSNWLKWDDVVWNLNAKRPPVDCSWMAHKITMPLAKAKAMYPNAKTLEGAKSPDVDDDTFKRSAYKDDIKVAVIWEVWDTDGKEILLLAEGLKDQYLEDPKPWPEYQSQYPFSMYFDFIVPNSSRPMSAIAPWEPQLLEKMVIMGSAVNHAKRWNRQAFVKNGQIDDNALDKYERGDDGAVITYNGDNADIKFADFGPLPTDFYLLMDRLDAMSRSINGQPEFSRGGVTKTNTRTIGELQLMEQGVQGRQARKVDRLETHLENIAKLMKINLEASFDMEEAIKITGETPDNIIQALGQNYNPQTQTVTFTPEEIKGEYDVSIKAGSTLPLDRQNKIRMLETILTTVAQAVASGNSMSPFMHELIQEILKEYDIKGLREAYDAEVAQKIQAAQQDKGKQTVEQVKTQAETAKRMAQTQQIKVQTELDVAKAKLDAIENPKNKPSESISFKDLPPLGKIQMAEQAGIHLTPEQASLVPATNGSPTS
jgi:hypothetical protein